MIDFERILCPSDFSPFSRRALDVSLLLASHPQGAIKAFHVVTPVRAVPARSSTSPAPILLVPEDRGPLLEDLERFVEPARAQGLRIEVAIDEGDVAGAILREAQAWPADLVVMGTRGVCASEGWVVGSVTDSILKKCPCPVLAVPRPPEGFEDAPPASLRSILCPVDFSQPCRQALELAIGLAREAGARLTLLHILEWFPEEQVGSDLPLYVPEIHLDLTQEARKRMRAAIPQEELAGCEHEELVATGRPHRAILRICRERRADLIVLGIHGRRAIDQVLSGATVCHVVREAGCPILAVRPQ